MTFKQLVKMIHGIKTEEDRDEVCGAIAKSFESERITYSDYNLLFDLAYMVVVRK